MKGSIKAAVASMMLATCFLPAALAGEAGDDTGPLVEMPMTFDASRRRPKTGDFFARHKGVLVRTGPGLHFPAPYRVDDPSLKMVARSTVVPDFEEWEKVWYEVDLGNGRTGFVEHNCPLPKCAF